MRKSVGVVSVLLIFSIIVTSCSKSNIAQNTEYDDMYFSAQDREQLSASTKEFYSQNFVETYQETLKDDEVTQYEDVNYSSKTVNPEYISKYTNEDLDTDDEYFDSDYNKSEEIEKYKSSSSNSYSSYSSPARNWNIYPSIGFGFGSMYGMPYSMSTFSLGLSYGMGGMGYPYSYRPYGSFYDPFYSPYGGYGYGSPYYWDNYGGYGSYAGTGFGYSPYCPSPYTGNYTRNAFNYYAASNNDVSAGAPVSVRRVIHSPRTTRGGSNYSGDNDYRSNDNRVYIDGSSPQQGVSASDDARSRYYRRTRPSNVSESDTRSYQRANSRSNSYNESTTYIKTRGSGESTSGYTRSSRSRSSVQSSRTAAKSSGFRYGSTTNRSSGSYKGSNVRSSSSYRSGSNSGTKIRSTPSRSSSSFSGRSAAPSRGSSSGATRSSSRRGGN